uniref:Uncharacterized protein n=1 Tax=Sphaerodactylus townsendi TaxID=933632 RepID=A0ACB8EAE2_9SAUR
MFFPQAAQLGDAERRRLAGGLHEPRANESYRNVCGRQSAGSGVASTARGPPKPPGPSQERLPGEASHTRMLGRVAAAVASAGAREQPLQRRWEPAVVLLRFTTRTRR